MAITREQLRMLLPILASYGERRRQREQEELDRTEDKAKKQRREDLLYNLGSLAPAGFAAGFGKAAAERFWNPAPTGGTQALPGVGPAGPMDLSQSVPFSLDGAPATIADPAAANPLAATSSEAPLGAQTPGAFGNFAGGVQSLFTGTPTPAGPAGAAGYWALPAAASAKAAYELGKAFSGDYHKGQYGFKDLFSLKGPRVAASLFGSGKGPDQRARDQARAAWQESGFLDDDYRARLANGKYVDVAASDYNVDINDPKVGQAVGMLNPLVSMTLDPAHASSTDKQHVDMTGSLTNAALNGDPVANIRGFYEQAGIKSLEDAVAKLNSLGDAITPEEKNAYLAAFHQVWA